MRKLKKIFESTITKTISAILIVAFCCSVFFFFDFYKRQYHKLKGCYWIYQGDKAFKNEDLQNAIYCYKKGIKLHPKHYRALYNLANIYVVYEDYYSALECYEKALKINPNFEVARIDYAIILSETYNIDEAIEQYKKVIKSQDVKKIALPFVNYNSKYKYFSVPLLKERKEGFQYNIGVAYYNLGLAYRTKSLLAGLEPGASMQYLDKAQNSYEEATEVLKTYNVNYNLGLIHQLLKNRKQAGYYYCKAMEIAPMEYEAHFNLAILLYDMNKYDSSAKEFVKAGLILDSKGETVKSAYIYNVLDEAYKKIAITKEEVKNKENNEEGKDKKDKKTKKKNKSNNKQDPMYKAGKLIIDSSVNDEELEEDFKMCAERKMFIGDESEE